MALNNQVNKNMKINYQHPALSYHDPITGKYNEDINEEGELYVNAKYEVCSSCDGHGSYFRSDLDENALVEGMRDDCDEEGIDAYYGGSFDQICSECHGKRVVANPTLPDWADTLLQEWYQIEKRERNYAEQERRMGA